MAGISETEVIKIFEKLDKVADKLNDLAIDAATHNSQVETILSRGCAVGSQIEDGCKSNREQDLNDIAARLGKMEDRRRTDRRALSTVGAISASIATVLTWLATMGYGK